MPRKGDKQPQINVIFTEFCKLDKQRLPKDCTKKQKVV